MHWGLLGWSAMSTWNQFPIFQRPFLPVCMWWRITVSLKPWKFTPHCHSLSPKKTCLAFFGPSPPLTFWKWRYLWTTVSILLTWMFICMITCAEMWQLYRIIFPTFFTCSHEWMMFVTTGERAVMAVYECNMRIMHRYNPQNWNLRDQWTQACSESPFTEIWLHIADETS
jgi:hypothetical protein